MPLAFKVFSYDAELVWEGARTAVVTAGDRSPLRITPPHDFPGGDPSAWSPEHLFLASLESCTMLSFLAHCSHNGVEVVGYRAAARGELARREVDRRYAFRRVEMTVRATVAGGHVELARSLTPKAERDCFISASINTELRVDWRIEE